MDVQSALRRIKRQFGDEYNVVIIDQDIYDWIYDSELDIIRATSDNDLTIPVASTRFPIQVPDKVNIKRLSVNGRALTNVALSQIDMIGSSATSAGGVTYWYYQGGMAYLWPVPESSDKTTIDVTYIRTPTQMTVVAPYLQFNINPTAIQVGQVVSDDDWKLSQSVNVAMELSIDNLAKDFVLLSCGADATTANNHFSITYKAAGNLLFTVSDGTTVSNHTLDFLTPIIAGDTFKFRITFNNATDTASLYKIDQYTGAHVLQEADTLNQVRNVQTTTSADLFIGNTNLTVVPTNVPSMKVYSVELRKEYNADPLKPPIVFIFDGMNDLGDLVAVQSTCVTSSAHTLTSQGSIIGPAHNEFTIAEVYHEDIVKYCLARAHSKNQNFRAAEAEMEQYDRRVSTRRNEAQAPETALYKIADPDDYYDYVDYNGYS